nr:hypothetical protein [uncultured Draconibacterium sp.]
MKHFILPILILFALSAFSQVSKLNKSSLSIETIMQDPAKWIGTSPSDITWSEDGAKIYFQWNPEQDTLESLHTYDLSTKEIDKVSLEEKMTLPGRRGNYNSDKSKKVYTRNGNLFLLDCKSGKEKQLTAWLERASSPEFVLGDSKIAFTKDNNLFTIDPETGLITQLTNFVSGSEKKEQPSSEQAKWLEQQQKELFVVLQEREAKGKARENREEAEKAAEPLKIYTGSKFLSNISLSPTGDYIIYSLYERASNAKATSVTHHVTESGYTEEKNARAKVGSPQALVEMGIFDVKNNKLVTIEKSQIPGLKDLPDYLSDYPERMPKEGEELEDREVNLLGPIWNETEDMAVVVALSQDNKDRWILLLDPASGDLELLDRQRDEAWIGGPGIGGWGMSIGNMGWMPDGESVWFHSEESGYSHLYTANNNFFNVIKIMLSFNALKIINARYIGKISCKK